MEEDSIKKIVERLLSNVKETAKEKEIHNIVYHGKWYGDKK